MTHNETRNQLIWAGSELIVRQGFNHTGINAILSASGVPKGSFYYYFESKEAFGLAVIEGFAWERAQHMDAFLDDARVAPLQRVRNYLEDSAAEMRQSDFDRGCLIGNLGQELAAQNPVFRTRLDRVFGDWETRFAGCLDAARRAGEIPADSDARRLSVFLLAGWEGALLRAKVTRSGAPMQAFIDVFFDQVVTGPVAV
jgi:TetR/AcrR family transcriptional repressor of nem operon